MKILECLQIKEKAYMERLENGLKVFIIPKKMQKSKYLIWGTCFGSLDNEFSILDSGETIKLPDGVAHFLEHKMFEQPEGNNSLDLLTSMGIDANAYTTYDHTAYLIECNDDKNFYKGLDCFMNYVQTPYYTEENVEKEKGIIGQEIMMYDDDPWFQVYLSALKGMYSKCKINTDVVGSIESISNITPDILYKCYNNFYTPENMIFVACGDFNPEELLEQVRARVIKGNSGRNVRRIYPEEPRQICNNYVEKKMGVSVPLFMIGVKDIAGYDYGAKRCMAVEILLELLIGSSSYLYKELYERQLVFDEPSIEYEFSKRYAHVLIGGRANNPQKVLEMLKDEVKSMKLDGLNKEDFERIKRKKYGNFVMEFNSVNNIAKLFLTNEVRGVNAFDFLNCYSEVTIEYAKKILQEVFDEDKMVLSVVK